MRAVKFVYHCDICGQGEMRVTMADPQPGNPPRIQHRCTSCGHIEMFAGIEYPHINFEEDVPDDT